jgi:hypothetical protein
MIKFEHTEVVGWEAAVRGMRNPMNSWEKSDSQYCADYGESCKGCPINKDGTDEYVSDECFDDGYIIGTNDLALMKKLRNSGTDHRKFMRMIEVYVDITAPLYWWKEFDTYKVGTVANSCSTMHKIAEKEFTMEDFSCEHLISSDTKMTTKMVNGEAAFYNCAPINSLQLTINFLNYYRKAYIEVDDMIKSHHGIVPFNEAAKERKEYWWQMIQLLPSSYNQRRTVMLSYEVLANIYKSRKDHKLDEWRVGFCDWIKTLPHSELITGEANDT